MEQNLPASERFKFQEARASVEEKGVAEAKANEAGAADFGDGTFEKLLGHHGTKIFMQVRIAFAVDRAPASGPEA